MREAAGRSGLAEFARWWMEELAAMVPAGWRERFSGRGIAYVMPDGEHWRVLRVTAAGLAETARSGFASLEGGERRAAFRRLVADGGGGAANVWLVLPRQHVLERSAALPLAAEEALRDAVGFELDRLTPLAADQAVFDCRLVGRDVAGQLVTLNIAATARAPVEARIAQLRDLGVNVLGVGVEGDVGIAAQPFNLLAPEMRDPPATSRAVVAARALAGLAAALAMLALAYPVWQKREAIIELHPRLERAKAGADVADRLAKEIERLADEHNFVVSKKQGQYPVAVLLEDLSRLLPDNTWVQQLDMKVGPKVRELQISGESGSSSQLVEVLEKSGSLANASFKSPLTKGVTPGTERFLLAAEVKPRDLPEPIPESSLAVKEAAARPGQPPDAPDVSASQPTAGPAAAATPVAPGEGAPSSSATGTPLPPQPVAPAKPAPAKG